MPTVPISPAAAVNYCGFAKQSVKGTGVAPAYFAAYLEDVDVRAGKQIREIREGGSGLYVKRAVTDSYLPGFRFVAPARPDLTGIILALFFGDDAISGAADPWTHVITPKESILWASVERNLNDEVIERLVDAVFTEVVIDIRKRDSGPEAVLMVSGQALNAAYQGAATSDTYEADRPWLRSDAAWKLDNAVETNLERATITLRWLYDESLLTDAVTRADFVKLGFEAEVQTVQILNSADEISAYRGTHYGAVGGSAPSETVFQPATTNSFEVDLSYNAAGPVERALTLNIPKVSWHEAEFSPITPEAREAVKLTRTGRLIYDTTAVTATVVNGNNAAYDA